MAHGRTARQTEQKAADDESLCAALDCGVRDIDAVAVREQSIRYNKCVANRLEACDCCASATHCIYNVAFSAQDIRENLAGSCLILDEEDVLFRQWLTRTLQRSRFPKHHLYRCDLGNLLVAAMPDHLDDVARL
jgi:hypothetical protein